MATRSEPTIQMGLLADRPTGLGTAGNALYYVTDAGVQRWTQWQNSSWVDIAPGLTSSGVVPGVQQTYGSAVNTACKGNDTRLSDSRAPNGSAGGDLTGTYQNPTIKASVALTTPAIGAATGTSLAATGAITSSGTAGIGYATGAGGVVTQATSKATGVTLSKACGEITMNAAALAAATIVSFTLTNTTIAAKDVLIINHASGGTGGAYLINAQCAAGSAVINVRNETAGSLSEAIVLRFVLVKAVTA